MLSNTKLLYNIVRSKLEDYSDDKVMSSCEYLYSRSDKYISIRILNLSKIILSLVNYNLDIVNEKFKYDEIEILDLPSKIVINEGQTSKIFKVNDDIVLKRFFYDTSFKTKTREIRALVRLRDYNYIVNMKGISIDHLGIRGIYIEKLQSNLKDVKIDNIELFKEISLKIINCVKYIHSLQLVHSDIKPENILHNNLNDIKLCDFGYSYFDNIDDPIIINRGTPLYADYETLCHYETIPRKYDIWALGCVIAELILGYSFFEYNSPNTKSELITEIECIVTIKHYNQELAINNISEILSSTDIESDELYKLCELLSKVFNKACKRIEIDEILSHSFFY